MSAPKFIQAKKTTVYATISAVDTTVVLRRLLGHDGTELDMDDFGSVGYLTIDPGLSTEEIISFTGLSRATNGSVTLSGVTRGLVGVSPYGSGGTAYQHNAGAIVVISNNPQMYDAIIDYIDGIALAGTTDASLTGKGVVEAATTAEIDADTETGSTGALLSIDPSRLAASKYGTRLPSADEKSKLAEIVNLEFFGGDGSDGELNVSSGTTTLDLSTKEVWQFTSITVAPGATLTFTNGDGGGKLPVLKCQGDFDNQGTITTVGLGLPGGAGSAGTDYGAGAGTDGTDGSSPTKPFADLTVPDFGDGAGGGSSTSLQDAVAGTGGTGGVKNAGYFLAHPMNGASGGGASGGLGSNVGTQLGEGGDGGAGSLGLVIEVAGNFSNSGTITADGGEGEDGTNGLGNGSQSTGDGAGGGGGGGGAGSIIIRYIGTYSNSGTISVDGGAGGTGGNTANKSTGGGTLYHGAGGGGGGGGATAFNDASNGSNGANTGGIGTTKTGGDGGAGADGIIYVAQVTA